MSTSIGSATRPNCNSRIFKALRQASALPEPRCALSDCSAGPISSSRAACRASALVGSFGRPPSRPLRRRTSLSSVGLRRGEGTYSVELAEVEVPSGSPKRLIDSTGVGVVRCSSNRPGRRARARSQETHAPARAQQDADRPSVCTNCDRSAGDIDATCNGSTSSGMSSGVSAGLP